MTGEGLFALVLVDESKYKLYLPSEEELLKELKREYQAMEAAQPDKE